MTQRTQSFLASVGADWQAQEDALPSTLRNLKAAPRAKLRKIHRLVDALPKPRPDQVACAGKGCAHCCKMNVTITTHEAALIGQFTGMRPQRLEGTKSHPLSAFVGVACPFLTQAQTCGIYEVRPVVCRLHVSFFESSRWCEPDVSTQIDSMAILRYTGIQKALTDLEGGSPGAVADIRDFFPVDPKP